MKKIFTTIFAVLMVSAQVMAVTVADVCGQFKGDLNVGGEPYPNKEIFLLPGTVDNALTFVLPDFKYNAGKLGNIVLPNIPMDANGQLTLENATLYIDSISERATITIINGLEEGGITYNSFVSATSAQVILAIAAPSLVEPIFVLFQGNVVTDANYALVNGGFEGPWADGEPTGWHSFNSATGDFVEFIGGTGQFGQASDVRPGSKGANSALLSSKMVLGSVKANGNCTNGQINAGATTADDAANNYNFSDPSNTGFNTAFVGRPDSLVFWAKYQPADRNAANEVNKARASVILTTNARYQDPEAADYSAVKIADAAINYAATADLGWQRISVPFTYYQDVTPSYILATFTTNMTPGGGSSYSVGQITKVNVLDTVYLDDAELIYNNELRSLVASDENGAHPVSFDNKVAQVPAAYCDSCFDLKAESNGVGSQVFLCYDAANKCAYAYVIADNYAQTKQFNLYKVQFSNSPAEGIVEIPAYAMPYEKTIVNGQLLIRRGEQWFNASGVRVQ